MAPLVDPVIKFGPNNRYIEVGISLCHTAALGQGTNFSLVGGRYWLPLTVAGIILGADMVRIGMEDSVYLYPHKDDLIKGCGKVVESVAGIARYLGREVATPSEARKMLGLPQIHSEKY